MKKIDCILFDFNGTIVDDLDLCLNLLNTMLVKRNHKMVTLEEYLEIFTFPVIDYYVKAGFIFPEDDFDDLARYFIKEYKENNPNCKLCNGVREVLRHFKNKGIKMAIVSASEINMLKGQLHKYAINDYFFDVSGLDNINATSKIESAKMFVKKHQLNLENTLFIGDTLHDEEVADELGIQCVLVCSGHQSKSRLKTSKSLVIDKLTDLIDIIG